MQPALEHLEVRLVLAATPVGPEVLVNTFTAEQQAAPSVAVDPAGDSVVAWESKDPNSVYEIYAQRYNAAGAAQGGQFLVNAAAVTGKTVPSVAMDSAGDFVVAWESRDQVTPVDPNVPGSGSHGDVFARKFNAAGVAQGGEFLVNTNTFSEQRFPTLAMDQGGDFVVAWQSAFQDGDGMGVYAQRYNPAGVAQGPEFRVNTTTAGDQTAPSAAMDQGGDFVVAWQSAFQDGDGMGVYAQRYNPAGVAQGPEFRVNTTTAGDQTAPSAAMDQGGDFVVAWQSAFQDGDGMGVYAQRYNPAGVAQGSEFRVNTTTARDQGSPAAVMDAAGDFVVVWQGATDAPADPKATNFDIFAQAYSPAGVAQGGEFRVNTTTANAQVDPAAAVNAAGNLVIVWEGFAQTPPQDDDIFAQQFHLDVTCSCCDKTDITNVSFLIDGSTVVTDLRGNTHQGDQVQVNFTVLPGHTDQLSLVSYVAPGPAFDATTAGQQVVYQTDTGVFGPGPHTLTVTLPGGFYQVDFVCGAVIAHLGPAGSNNFYSPQNRLFSADNGGSSSCTVAPPVGCGQSASAGFWGGAKGQALVNSFNGGPTSTALASWLAATFPNLYGPGTAASPNPSDLTNKTNARVAALVLTLNRSNALGGPAQVLASALSVYATTLGLGGTAAAKYGFVVNGLGLGSSGVKVGTFGATFGVANNSTVTVFQLLQSVNARSRNGNLFSGSTTNQGVAARVLWFVNAAGGINA